MTKRNPNRRPCGATGCLNTVALTAHDVVMTSRRRGEKAYCSTTCSERMKNSFFIHPKKDS